MANQLGAHEIIHNDVTHDKEGVVFKLDYEKAYDRVSKEFLLKIMYQRGFSPKWMRKVESILYKGSVGVRINDCNSEFFKTFKGVRQGDPASPLLFNLVAYVFSRMLNEAAKSNILTGLMTNLFPLGVTSQQYADDTLLFIDNNLVSARNLKWLLSCFEHMSGLRINFHKCELVPINVDREEATKMFFYMATKMLLFTRATDSLQPHPRAKNYLFFPNLSSFAAWFFIILVKQELPCYITSSN